MVNPGVPPEPRVRRGYFECRYGQLHARHAMPSGGGFDEGTPLLLVHHSPMSGAVFDQVMPALARERTVYAPDLPGFGASDRPQNAPSIADYAGALADFLDTMRLREIDVAGYQSGALVAMELALLRPTSVRRVVCVSVPIADEADREAFRRDPWPAEPAADGSHLMAEWERVRAMEDPPLAVLDRIVCERLGHGTRAWWGTQAALAYPTRERLALLEQPLLLVRVNDECSSTTLEALKSGRRAQLAELPDAGHEAFERAPDKLSRVMNEFLGRRR